SCAFLLLPSSPFPSALLRHVLRIDDIIVAAASAAAGSAAASTRARRRGPPITHTTGPAASAAAGSAAASTRARRRGPTLLAVCGARKRVRQLLQVARQLTPTFDADGVV